jgi:hypothetical protein
MKKDFTQDGRTQVEEILGINKKKQQEEQKEIQPIQQQEAKEEKTHSYERVETEHYIRYSSYLPKRLKKKISYYALENDLKDYQVLEQAIEEFFKTSEK